VQSYNFGMSTSTRILEARARAGLSQSQLAARAGVPQPNLSAYEAGRVQPRPETLARILAATAERPSVVLRRERDRVLELAGHRRAGAVRVFGSIARGADTVRSDVDLLVTFAPDASLLDAAGLVLDLETLLGVHVDLMSDRAEGAIRDRAVAEAVPL
jgi:predicted nucleotidyltransferase